MWEDNLVFLIPSQDFCENDEEILNSVRKKWDVNPYHGFDFDDYALMQYLNYKELSYPEHIDDVGGEKIIHENEGQS